MLKQITTTLLKKLKKCLIPTGDNLFPFVACFSGALSDASKWWQQYVFIPNLLKCSRVTIAILIFATVFLLLPNSQGQELTIRLSDNLLHSIVFLSGVVIWAFQSWIGTRKILDEIEGPSNRSRKPQLSDSSTPGPHLQLKGHTFYGGLSDWSTCFISCLKSEKAWLEHLPRVLGLFVFIITTVALLYPVIEGRIALFSMHGVLILANLALALVFYTLLMNRRDWICQQMGDIEVTGVEQSSHWAALDNMHSMAGKITIIYVTVLLLLATFLPVWLGFTFGSAGIAVLGFSSLTAVGNFIIRSIVTQNHKPDYATATQFPVLTVLFLIAVVFSFINDNHGIRLVSGEPAARPKLAEFAKQWADLNSAADAQTTPKTPRPMIFVATAGGGIRASHWTLAVLTHLADNNPRFADSVFAISGVSGGSVGASIYNALLKENTDCQSSDPGKDCLQNMAKKLLSQDFLGPVVSALLFNDLLQRFLPVGILPDRQKALEKGWEKAFETEVGNGNGGLAAPYSSLWNKTGGTGKWLPLLLLNNTHMETGKKIIASPFPLDPAGFLDDVDLFQLLNGRDVPLSSAAGNSARFTYVSPPGTMPYDGSFFKFWEDNGHILDGGYFENNGAGTLQALIQSLQILEAEAKQTFFQRHAIKPIVVLITNDSSQVCEKSDNESVECDNNVVIKPERQLADKAPAITDFNGEYTQLTDNSGANEILGPLKAIYNTRGGHGISAAKKLISWVGRCQISPESCNLSGNAKPEFFHFRIDLNEGEYPPALGWVLSEDSEELIWDKLQTSEHNKTEMDRLLGMLEGSEK